MEPLDHRHRQRGFTLIELVVVVVILGVLSAVAVTRYIDMEAASRLAYLQGMQGAMRSAAEMVHGRAVSEGKTDATGSVTIDGHTVTLAYGYPDGALSGIANAVQGLTDFPVSYFDYGGPNLIQYTWGPGNYFFGYSPIDGGHNGCFLNYGAATATTTPRVDFNSESANLVPLNGPGADMCRLIGNRGPGSITWIP